MPLASEDLERIVLDCLVIVIEGWAELARVKTASLQAFVLQTWRLQPTMQKEVDAALAQLDSYAKPTIAFHGEFFCPWTIQMAKGWSSRLNDI